MRRYTEKANASHGYHVPTPQTASNAKFLRNDNTWQTVTPANIGAAPSGYGLGDFAISIDSSYDLNNIKEFGLYEWGSSKPVNAPSQYMLMIPIFRHSTEGVQYFQSIASGIYSVIGKRYMNGGEWGELEYSNPPMSLGVEYRTTRRHLGKVVYASTINCGSFPATPGTHTDFKTGIEYSDIVDWYANTGGNARWSVPYLDRQTISIGYYQDSEDQKFKIGVMLSTVGEELMLDGDTIVTLFYTKD